MTRITSLVAAVNVLLLFVDPSYAQPAVTSIAVTTQPALSVAAQKGEGKIYSVPGGSTLQVVVTATYSDGSTQDVSSDPATTYLSWSPAFLTIDNAGLATCATPAEQQATPIQVQHGSHTELLSLVLEP